jgi:hypothetical protein
LDLGNKKHRSVQLPGPKLTSVPASVASILVVGRFQLTISLSLAITAHRLVNWPKARGGENKKERSKPFSSFSWIAIAIARDWPGAAVEPSAPYTGNLLMKEM